MRTIAAFFCAAIAFFSPLAASGQYYTIRMDTQTPSVQPTLDRVFTGNTPYLRVMLYENGVPLTRLATWSWIFRYGYGQYDTNGMVSLYGTLSSNVVTFAGTTNIFFEDRDDYYWSLIGTSPEGYTKTFGTGRMVQSYDPAAGDPAALNWLRVFNWNHFTFTGEPPWIGDTNYFVSAWSVLLATNVFLPFQYPLALLNTSVAGQITPSDTSLWNTVAARAFQSDFDDISNRVDAIESSTSLWDTVEARAWQDDFIGVSGRLVTIEGSVPTWDTVTEKAPLAGFLGISNRYEASANDITVLKGSTSLWNTVLNKAPLPDFLNLSNRVACIEAGTNKLATIPDLTNRVSIMEGRTSLWDTVANMTPLAQHQANTAEVGRLALAVDTTSNQVAALNASVGKWNGITGISNRVDVLETQMWTRVEADIAEERFDNATGALWQAISQGPGSALLIDGSRFAQKLIVADTDHVGSEQVTNGVFESDGDWNWNNVARDGIGNRAVFNTGGASLAYDNLESIEVGGVARLVFSVGGFDEDWAMNWTCGGSAGTVDGFNGMKTFTNFCVIDHAGLAFDVDASNGQVFVQNVSLKPVTNGALHVADKVVAPVLVAGTSTVTQAKINAWDGLAAGSQTNAIEIAVALTPETFYLAEPTVESALVGIDGAMAQYTNLPDRVSALEGLGSMFRYNVMATAGEEIEVLATAEGVTATRAGTTITMNIPSGVHLLSMRARWDGNNGSAFTLNMGTNDMANTGMANRWGAVFQAYNEATGALIPGASCRLSLDNAGELDVMGLPIGSRSHLRFGF